MKTVRLLAFPVLPAILTALAVLDGGKAILWLAGTTVGVLAFAAIVTRWGPITEPAKYCAAYLTVAILATIVSAFIGGGMVMWLCGLAVSLTAFLLFAAARREKATAADEAADKTPAAA